jgi:selenocysteine-specific elongation factor
LVAVREDLFVVRSYSPARTLGGGRIIDAHPPRHRRMRATTLMDLAREDRGDPADLVTLALARASGRPLTAERVARTAMLSRPRTLGELEKGCKAGTALSLGEGLYLDAGAEAAARKAASAALAEFHGKFPLRPGMPKEELRSRVAARWETKDFGLLLDSWVQGGLVQVRGQEVALAGHDPAVSAAEERRLTAMAEAFSGGGVSPPTLHEVALLLGTTDAAAEELAARLVKDGRLVKVSEELYFSPAVLERVRQVLQAHFATEKALAAAAFKDLLGVTRKFAIPLLEHCDRIRWTRRVADVRIAGTGLNA